MSLNDSRTLRMTQQQKADATLQCAESVARCEGGTHYFLGRYDAEDIHTMRWFYEVLSKYHKQHVLGLSCLLSDDMDRVILALDNIKLSLICAGASFLK